MKTEDLFKYGVTPKEGKFAGRRFAVVAVKADGVDVHPWDKSEDLAFFSHGRYDLWNEPKTLFEDSDIAPTWGNLKKAMEMSGLGDDTMFAVPDFIIGFRKAEMRTEKLRSKSNGEDKIYIIVE